MSPSRPIIIAVIVGSLVVVGGGVALAAVAGSGGSTTEAASAPTTAPSSTPDNTTENTTESAAPQAAGGESVAPEAAAGENAVGAAASAGAYVDWSDGIIEATPGTKVLFFHATWCPNCRQLDEQLLAEGAPDGLTVIKVDFDSQTELRQRYGVTLQTTVVYVNDAGEALGSSVLYSDPSIASLVAAAP